MISLDTFKEKMKALGDTPSLPALSRRWLQGNPAVLSPPVESTSIVRYQWSSS